MSKQYFNPFTKLSEGEIIMEKNPMASSPHLIEYFLIMGYDESYIQEKIIKNFNSQTQIELESAEQKSKKLNPEIKILNESKCRNLPSILFSLGSNFSDPLESENELIKRVFPIPPSVLYTIIDNFLYDPMANDVVFSNIQNTVVNIGYAHIFYESKNILDNIRIYIPKAFVIISQYPLFLTFKNICMEILNQFKNKLLQIPIEIQLYNIINFIPAPVDYDISMTLFPFNELSEISAKCLEDKQLIHLDRQREYRLSQLSGYRDTEVDISAIFCILNSDIIIEIFIQVLAGHTVAILSNNISLLNMTIFIFQEMFYPISNDETVTILSPLKFFNSDMIDRYIVGFACSFDDLFNYQKSDDGTFKSLCDDDEEPNEDSKHFDCDFILDLDKKKFEYLELEDSENLNAENVKKISDLIKKIINSHIKDSSSTFEKALRNLSNNLNEIAFKLTYGNKNQAIPDYFVAENQFNRKIQNAFYSFMLDISHEFFRGVSKYIGDQENTRKIDIKSKEECDLNEDEYLFFSLFYKTSFYQILNNFVGGYEKGELAMYRTPKMIFENLLNIRKLSEKLSLTKLSDNFYELIDEIYGKSDNTKEISFLNFYKYYKEHMTKDIYDVVSNKYVNAKLNKAVKTNIKYYYEYNGINLDKNLIFEYKYLIDEIPPDVRKKIFNMESNNCYEIYKPINLKITQRSIYNCIEQYFIRTKSIDHITIINFSILNIVALTTYKRTLTPFIPSIYDIFMHLPCSVRKYQEIIFSIALRLIKEQRDFSYQSFEKYFTLYEMCKELGLYLNDQLINLLKEINELKGEGFERHVEILDKKCKEIIEKDVSKLLSCECKKKPKEMIPLLQVNINKPISNGSKLTFKSKYYNGGKKVEYKDIISPIMIYNTTNEMLDKYLQDLDHTQISRTKFDESVIHLIYFTQLIPDKFPKEISKFLLYCLDENKKK